MSTEIIPFIARPGRDCQPSDFPTIVFRAIPRPETSATKDSDTTPCEYVPPTDGES